VNRNPISRRQLLAGAAASVAAACGRRKAVGFRGYCFVANAESRSIAVVDLVRFGVRKQIPLGESPSGVLAHPSKPKVFVLAADAGIVYEIDPATLTVGRRVQAGAHAAAMRLNDVGDTLWVLYSDPPALVEVPVSSFQPRRRIPVGTTPGGFDLQEDTAAIASPHDGTIMLASLGRGAAEHTVNVGADPSFVTFRRDGRQLLVGSREEKILSIFNVVGGRLVVRLPLPFEPRRFCFNADGGQLFISGDGMDAVVIVYPYRTEVAETMLAGRAPDGMAVTANPPYLLVTNPETDSVTVLDFDNLGKKLVAVVQVGREPRHIVLTPDHYRDGTPRDQYALVLNEKSGDVAVIRILSLATGPGGKPRLYHAAPLFTMIPVGGRPVSADVLAFD
jgi:DNA-binding beta-propeller fold protein YncE